MYDIDLMEFFTKTYSFACYSNFYYCTNQFMFVCGKCYRVFYILLLIARNIRIWTQFLNTKFIFIVPNRLNDIYRKVNFIAIIRWYLSLYALFYANLFYQSLFICICVFFLFRKIEALHV